MDWKQSGGYLNLINGVKLLIISPKHSLKIGFTSDDKFIETITFAGVYVYDDVYKLKGKHFSKFEASTPQFIVKILNNNGKTYLASVFNGIYTYENGVFTSLVNAKIWDEKKFKHITSNERKQLILAAEFWRRRFCS